MDTNLLPTLGDIKATRHKLVKLQIEGKHQVRLQTAQLDGLLLSAEDVIEKQAARIQLLEQQMGQTATAISQLESQLTAQQAALATAQANALDASDQAAIAGVPAFLAGLSNASSGNASSGSTASSNSPSGITTPSNSPSGGTTPTPAANS